MITTPYDSSIIEKDTNPEHIFWLLLYDNGVDIDPNQLVLKDIADVVNDPAARDMFYYPNSSDTRFDFSSWTHLHFAKFLHKKKWWVCRADVSCAIDDWPEVGSADNVESEPWEFARNYRCHVEWSRLIKMETGIDILDDYNFGIDWSLVDDLQFAKDQLSAGRWHLDDAIMQNSWIVDMPEDEIEKIKDYLLGK